MTVFLLSACLQTGDKKVTNDQSGKKDGNHYEKENFVPITSYDGEGFTLRDSSSKVKKIIEKEEAAITKAVEAFFVKEYDTAVEVHHIAAAKDAASVYVGSKEAPYFYTFAIVPVDFKNKEVKMGDVWTKEGEVEGGIGGGLYAMAYEEEFAALDAMLEDLAEAYPIVGSPQKVIERVKGNGYTTPYYFISPFGQVFKDAYGMYEENPDRPIEEWRELFESRPLEDGTVSVGVEFYMEEEGTEPSEEIFSFMEEKIREADDIPRGEYFLFLNDHYIDKRRGIGKKENTIELPGAETIMKK